MYGEALKAQRQMNGYTQKELSKATGIVQPNISAWENNIYSPNIEFCVILADFYGISIDELIGRDGAKANWKNYVDQRENKGTINNNFK